MSDLFNTFEPRPLRPHQETGLTQLRQSLGRGNRRVVLHLPTGAGKTRLAAEIVNKALGNDKKVAFTVPAISLIDQTVESFSMEGIIDLGVMQASHALTHYGMPAQVCSVQTIAKRGFPEADVVIVDECHLRFKAISEWMKRDPRKIFIGLSATPWARGMSEDWQDLVSPVSMQDLIDAGFLSPFRVYAPSHPDLSNVRTKAGDYHEGDLAEAMGATGLTADIVETWLKYAERRPTLVFAVDRAHAAKLQLEFARAGVEMGYCDAYTDLIERKLLFDQMARGVIAGICNVGTLTTGVDADVRCVVLARPTKSEMLHVQIIGRGLRTAPGKADCLILDHADNHARLGFVTDIHHDQLLSGKDKAPATRKEKGEKMPKECPSCGVLKATGGECPSCGFTPTRTSEIEPEAGELVEITRTKKKPEPSMDEKQRWYSELLGVANLRKRNPGWAFHTYRKRFGKGPPNSLVKIAAPPSPETLAYARSLDIAFAKARGRGA